MGRHAPADVVASERRNIQLIHDLKTICTSHVERFNCTTRQFVRRFCRLTLRFSKKLASLEASVAMHVANFDFCWRTRTPGKTGSDALRPRCWRVSRIVCGRLPICSPPQFKGLAPAPLETSSGAGHFSAAGPD